MTKKKTQNLGLFCMTRKICLVGSVLNHRFHPNYHDCRIYFFHTHKNQFILICVQEKYGEFRLLYLLLIIVGANCSVRTCEIRKNPDAWHRALSTQQTMYRRRASTWHISRSILYFVDDALCAQAADNKSPLNCSMDKKERK